MIWSPMISLKSAMEEAKECAAYVSTPIHLAANGPSAALIHFKGVEVKNLHVDGA